VNLSDGTAASEVVMGSFGNELAKAIAALSFNQALHLVGILLLGLLVPVAIYFGRNNLRQHRRKIVHDLQAMFNFAKSDGGQPIIIPSFELVKYKYDPESRAGAAGREPEQARWWHYAFPVGLYVILASLGFDKCFSPADYNTPQLSPYLVGGNSFAASSGNVLNPVEN
jgi:hypothetical protein